MVKVGYTNKPGIIERAADGTFSGYTYDYLTHVAQYAGWTYEFVASEGQTDDEHALDLLNMLETGEVDIEGSMVYSAELAKLYEYPQNSYGMAHTSLFAPVNGGLTQTNLTTRETLRVAIFSSAKQRRAELAYFCEQNKMQLELVECETLEQMQQAVFTGSADAFLDIDVGVYDGFEIVAAFSGRPYFFAAPHGQRDVIDQIDAAIARINEANPTLQSVLYDEYFMKANTNYVLSDEELAFARNHDTLRVGVLSNKQPVQSIDPATGELSGVTRGMLDYLTEHTGLRFEVVPLERSDNLAKVVRDANVDIVAGIDSNYMVASEIGLSLTAPYLTASSLVVYNKFVNPHELDQKKLAVPWELSSLADGRSNVLVCGTLKQCFEAVNDGRADFTYANTYSASYYTSTGGLGNVLTLPESASTSETAFGIVQPIEPELLLVMNKSIRGLSAPELDSIIYSSTLIDQDEQVSLFVQDHLLELAVACISVLVLVIVLLALYLRTRMHAAQRVREENLRFQKLYSLTNERLFEYFLADDTLILSNPKDQDAYLAKGIGEASEDKSYCIVHHAHAQIAENADPEMLDAFTLPNSPSVDLPYEFAPGDQGWLRIMSHVVTNDEGRPISVIGKIMRIDDEVRERQDLSKRAHHDGLTGLLNWETFRERAEELLAAGKAGALLVIDTDDFKSVNDTYGHLAGDAALRQTADALRRAFRPHDLIGRLGGDEFGVLVTGTIDRQQLADRCTRIVEEGVTYRDQSGSDRSLTLSIGGVVLAGTQASYREAYQQADSALYRAKADGKDRFFLEGPA